MSFALKSVLGLQGPALGLQGLGDDSTTDPNFVGPPLSSASPDAQATQAALMATGTPASSYTSASGEQCVCPANADYCNCTAPTPSPAPLSTTAIALFAAAFGLIVIMGIKR